MAKTRAAKETSLPVIIALVFFVLTTIGLGVFVYVLYSDQEMKDAAVAKAQQDLTNARKGEKEAQQIALVTRTWVGLTDGDDLKDLPEIKEGDKAFQELKRLNELAKKRGPETSKASVDKFNDALAQYYRALNQQNPAAPAPKLDVTLADADLVFWPGEVDDKRQLKPPARNMLDVAAKAYQFRDLALNKAVADQAAYDNVLDLIKKASDAYQLARKEFADKAIKMPEALNAHMTALTKTSNDRLLQYQKDHANTRKEITDLKNEIDNRDTRERAMKNEIKKLKEENLALLVKIKPTDPFQYDEPQGKITNRPETGVVEINLGSNANVRPGLTFTVLPRDFPEKGRQSRMKQLRHPDDRGVYQTTEVFVPKATIEVTEVLGPDLSRARITSEDSDIRDRAMTGDLLYNSVWRKGQADHVALVGIFDINGDGTDDIAAVIRDLNNMGVKVDAYLNLNMKELKWVGALTDQTRYVVQGAIPTPTVNDPNAAAKQRLNEAIKKAKDEAIGRGIVAVNARDFFGRMGYRVRADVSEDRINQAAAAYLSGVGTVEAPPPNN
ncbi:MAG: hypothetical protein JWO38_7716 [Gemmataceae bacterium]|nr:hypothetical protein [Gemmataceae bacterium]